MTRVLLVDDDPDLRRMLARDLVTQGLDVVAADSFDDALDALAREAPFDVLVCDLRMPGQDGLELLQAVRARDPAIQAILMSAFATARDYELAIEHGAVAVLSKPFSRAQLRAAIDRAQECRTGFHGSVHGLTLVDVLQMLHLGRRSVAVSVTGARSGVIYLGRGSLIDATTADGLHGEAAVAALLAAPMGRIATGPLPADRPRSIDRRFDAVVLDALRSHDEASRDVPEDPFVDAFLDGGDDVFAALAAGTGAPRAADDASLDAAAPAPTDVPPAIAAARAAIARDGALFDAAGVDVVIVRPTDRRAWTARGAAPSDLVAAFVALIEQLAGRTGPRGAIELVRPGHGVALAWATDVDVAIAVIDAIATTSSYAWFRARSSAVARIVHNAHSGN